MNYITFYEKYRKLVNGMVVLTFFLTFLYFFGTTRSIIDSISNILAIPGFLMVFIVLDTLNILPSDLDDYYTKREMKKLATKKNKRNFVQKIADSRTPVERNVKKIYKYTTKVSNGGEVAPMLTHDCLDFYEDAADYVKETSEYVMEVLKIMEKDIVIDKIDPIDLSGILMKKEEIDKLKSELLLINESYFKNERLEEDKIERLKLIYSENTGLFNRYYSLCEVVYLDLEGGRE